MSTRAASYSASVFCGAAWAITIVLAALSVGSCRDAGAASSSVVALVAIAPGVWLSLATRRGRRLTTRNALHTIGYGVLIGWVVPIALLRVGDGSLHAWAPHDNVAVQVFVLPGVLAVAAVAELGRRDAASVVPLEPPRCLVFTGPFAYVANPIQCAKVLTLAAWAVFACSWTILAATVLLFAVGALVTAPLERRALDRTFGADHHRYRAAVRVWWPRWRPWSDPSLTSARLELADACNPCDALGDWLRRQSPRGLIIVTTPALPRMRYVGPGGTSHGIAALCHALEHVHLGWAFFGWAVRLPVVRYVAETIYEASVPQRGACDAADGGLRGRVAEARVVAASEDAQ